MWKGVSDNVTLVLSLENDQSEIWVGKGCLHSYLVVSSVKIKFFCHKYIGKVCRDFGLNLFSMFIIARCSSDGGKIITHNGHWGNTWVTLSVRASVLERKWMGIWIFFLKRMWEIENSTWLGPQEDKEITFFEVGSRYSVHLISGIS